MIQKFEISAVHTTLDERLEKYIQKKLVSLDRYLPRRVRDSAHAEIILKEEKAPKHDSRKNPFTCEVTLHLPHDVINISESTSNMYSAIDIIEAKLKHRIQKYKDLHAPGLIRRRLANRTAKTPAA